MAEILRCIDGGGTKAQAATCNRQGRVMNIATGNGSNPQDNQNWCDNLDRTIAADLSDFVSFECSVVGMPDYDEVATIDKGVQVLLGQALGANRLTVNDVGPACRSAFSPGDRGLWLAAQIAQWNPDTAFSKTLTNTMKSTKDAP